MVFEFSKTRMEINPCGVINIRLQISFLGRNRHLVFTPHNRHTTITIHHTTKGHGTTQHITTQHITSHHFTSRHITLRHRDAPVCIFKTLSPDTRPFSRHTWRRFERAHDERFECTQNNTPQKSRSAHPTTHHSTAHHNNTQPNHNAQHTNTLHTHHTLRLNE